jgi:hypothetical protein
VHGGTGGSPVSLTLATGETLISATVCWDQYNNWTQLFYAQVTTSKGASAQVGVKTATCTSATAPAGFGIVGASGQDDTEIYQLAWVYAQQ